MADRHHELSPQWRSASRGRTAIYTHK